jgi:hypothetical protein
MEKMQSLNNTLFQTFEAQEMSAVKGGYKEAFPNDGGTRVKTMENVTIHSNGKPAQSDGGPEDDGPDW